MGTPLKLRAVDAADFAVLGAYLQDALVPVQDMRFLGEENRFVMVANRFCWENLAAEEDAGAGPGAGQGGTAAGSYERVHCGITFEHVLSVEAKGFTPGAAADRGRLLEVLTILAEGDVVTLVFSGGAAVRLSVETVEAFVQDMGEPWPTMWRPHHPVEDELDQDGGTR
ncbi:MAG: DUF2948 family protein [Alphaproteobacteria bacterium]|nr:DUF2948 family protein [Pseudomonadota bacterium]TDI68516.1 MAG: DUF2948 family protein [Alphaproteobacteria bacterium]